MQTAGFLPLAARRRIAQRRHAPRIQIADSVHHTRGSEGEHRQTERFQSAEDPEFGSQAHQQLADEIELVDGVLDAGECVRFLCDLLDCLRCDRDGRAAGDVVDDQGQRRALGNLHEIFDETALRRPDVIRSDDEERIDLCFFGQRAELESLLKRSGACAGYDR